MYSCNCCNHINNPNPSFGNRPCLCNNNHNNVDLSSLLPHFPSPPPPPPPPPPCDEEEAAVVNELTWQQLYDLFFFQQQQQINYHHETVVAAAAAHHHVISTNYNNMAMAADAEDILKREEEEQEQGGGNKKISTCMKRVDQHHHHQIISSNSSSSRKRSSKKDRHSKINTARGPRDRRMRLSLDVAGPFFGLQDKLGFDKGSKTVEWLMIKASAAIKEVMGISQSSSMLQPSISDEGVSGIDDSTTTTTTENQPSLITKKVKVKLSSTSKATGNNNTTSSKQRRRTSAFLDRESRNMARERARKRTMEKKRLNFVGHDSSGADHCHNAHLHQSPKIVPPPSHHHPQLLQDQTLEYVPPPHHDDDSLVITADWNTSDDPFSNFHQNPQIAHEQHHFTDFDRSLLY